MATEFKGKSVNTFGNSLEYLLQFSNESSIMENYEEIEPSEYINTGCYMLNAQISGSMIKGAASNKVFLFAGDPKVGKSYVLYGIMRNCQKMGYIPYLFESENSPDKERMRNQSVDMNSIIFEQPETVDDIIIPLVRMTETMKSDKKNNKPIPKVAVFIDSLTALNSTKQYRDAIEGEAKQDMGTVAKDLKRLFSMLTVRLGKLGIPVFCTAHVYEKDMGHFRKRVPTGGNAALFMASYIGLMSKKEDKDKETKESLGIYVTVEVVDSRYSKPVPIEMYISRSKGMNPYYKLEEYVSWDTCGIDKGKLVQLTDMADELLKKKIITEENILSVELSKSDIVKNLSKAKSENIDHHIDYFICNGLLINNNGKYNFTEEILKRFVNNQYQPIDDVVGIVNKASSQYIVRHLKTAFTSKKDIYNKNVFTQEVLKQIDDNVIRNIFEYKKNEIEDIINGIGIVSEIEDSNFNDSESESDEK